MRVIEYRIENVTAFFSYLVFIIFSTSSSYRISHDCQLALWLMGMKADRQLYSWFQAKVCTTFLALACLLSLSACSNAYDSHLRSHSQDVLPIWATKINVYGHRSPESTIFCLKKKSDILWCSLGSSDHIHWFQWLQLAIHHGYVTLDESHMHWNKQKDL